jgi:hypothetical protein
MAKKKKPYRILAFDDYDIDFILEALKIANQIYSSAANLIYVEHGAAEKNRKMAIKHCKKLAHFFALKEGAIASGLHDQN